MTDLRAKLLRESGLTEQDLADCASLTLPPHAADLLDLTPAQIIRAIDTDDRRTLSASRSVWIAGWEPSTSLARLLATLRSQPALRKDLPAATGIYRVMLSHLERFGRIRHPLLLGRSVETMQRVMMRLRRKTRLHPPAVRDLGQVRSLLPEDRP